MIKQEQQLKGIHHVTAMTDDVIRNHQFMTEVLGMRLVKKTVNQDDIHTYHTFFADDEGNAGTDMTFFGFPNQNKSIHGTNEISRAGFRVPNDEALEYYRQRFEEFGISHEPIEELFGSKVLKFEEVDGQKYQLFSDEHNTGVAGGKPWKNGPVPEDKAIYGLGPVEITVSYYEDFKKILETIYFMKLVKEENGVALYEMGEGGHGGQVIVREDTETSQSLQGYGAIHHVAFRVENEEALKAWEAHYQDLRIGNSGYVNRFYFGALYARVGHILIELSTDGPGFMTDEPYETLGEILSLPPFLESKREHIESVVKPFDTSDTNTRFKD